MNTERIESEKRKACLFQQVVIFFCNFIECTNIATNVGNYDIPLIMES